MKRPSAEPRSKVTTDTGLDDGVSTPRLDRVPSAARLQSWYCPAVGAVGTATAYNPASGALKTMGLTPAEMDRATDLLAKIGSATAEAVRLGSPEVAVSTGAG